MGRREAGTDMEAPGGIADPWGHEGGMQMREGETVVLRRGTWVESTHRCHAVVVDAGGERIIEVGDPSRVTFLRSAAKPFQALPLVEDGVAEALGFGAREVAVACGSHSGEPAHLSVVASMLARAGFSAEALACGPHTPMGEAAAEALFRSGGEPERIHNNCSGKHAAMLALARHHGWSPEGYEAINHPVQQRMLDEISRWCDWPTTSIRTGIDGCGVACFALPLERMAHGMARLLARAAAGDPGPTGVIGAMTAEPFMVAGTGRLCTELMEATEGGVVAKVGAEGVYLAGVRGRGLALALKIEDGSRRAAEVALMALLDRVGALSDAASEALGHWMPPREVANTRGEAAAYLEMEETPVGPEGPAESGIGPAGLVEGRTAHDDGPAVSEDGAGGETPGVDVALTLQARGLVRLSAALAAGDFDGLRGALEALAGQGADEAVEETLLQAHLFAGFPAALNALALWRSVSGRAPDPATTEDPELWARRGEALCRRIYGRAYEGLRENVSGLHPDLDRWMVVEGYGKVLGREGLHVRERELCVVAILAVQGAGVQLHSHLRGALRVGCGVDEVAEALHLALVHVDPGLRREMEGVWRAVRRRAALDEGAGSPAPRPNTGGSKGETEDVRR